MPQIPARISALVPSLVIGLLLLPLPLACQDADRPLFSDRAREIIEAEGAEDAIGELAVLLGTGSDTYVIDVDGMIELGRAYVADDHTQAGITVLTVATYADPSSADAIVALADAYAQREDAITASVYYEQALALDPTHSGARAGMEATGGALPTVPELPEDEAPSDGQADDAQKAVHAAADADPLAKIHEGPRRDDLGRFKGRYRAPADHAARPRRVYWIAETCLGSGYLMMGAEWGDVAPRVFRSESDLEFEQSNAGSYGGPLRLAFQGAEGGTAAGVELRGPIDADLERIGDLFEGSEREGEECYVTFM